MATTNVINAQCKALGTTLRKSEQVKLVQLEDVLATAKHWQIEEAKALLEIRQKRLYRLTHATFESYGAEKWGFDRAHLYRLCSWAEVMNAVSPVGDIPRRERHARPLYGLPPEHQREVWKQVRRRLGRTRTADEIETVTKAYLARATPQKTNHAVGLVAGVVLHGDAHTLVRTLDTRSVGLGLFSPPYCEQRAGEYPSISEAEFPMWMASLMVALKPALRDDASVLIVGREHVRGGGITDAWLKARLAIREAGFNEIDTLIWHKPDAPPLGHVDRPRRSYENVYWFSPSRSPYVDLKACGTVTDQHGWHGGRSSRQHTTRQKTDRACVARVTDMVVATVGRERVDHPAPFPRELADQLIRTFSRVDDVVVDPCFGSGTTLVAARDSGRRWWGCDVVREYVRYAARRLNESPARIQS